MSVTLLNGAKRGTRPRAAARTAGTTPKKQCAAKSTAGK